MDALADQIRRRPHVHDLGRTRIADRAGATHEQQRVGGDAERGIVDPVVIILRTVEHDRGTLERFEIVRVGQIALAELRRDDAGFHDRRVEQIAAQHDEPGILQQRRRERADDALVLDRRGPAIVADRLAVRGHRVFMDQPLLHQFGDHRWHAAGMVIIFAEILAGGLEIYHQRHLVAVRLPVVDRQVDADVTCDRGKVDRCVGRAPDRRIDDDRVVERLLCEDVGRLQIFRNHVDDPLAGAIRDLLAITVRRGDRGRAGQLHPERLGERIHRRRGAHRVARQPVRLGDHEDQRDLAGVP